MSRLQSIRLSLLAGSSLVAAGLSAAASVAVVAAPAPAFAQSVCTPTPTTGATTNSVTYSGNQTSGIVCTATGSFTLEKVSGTASSTTAYALDISSTGAATILNSGGSIGGNAQLMPNGSGAVDFSGVAGGVTFTNSGAASNTGRWLGSGASVFSAGNDTLNLSGIGENFLGGRNALAQASIDFGAGDDTLNLAAFFNIGGHTQDAGTIDFGDGDDTFNLSGVFTSHGGTLENLESFNHSGVIYMGVAQTSFGSRVVWTATDGVSDDILRAQGATFTGSGDARIVMDVDIGAGVQAGCETASGFADCLDLRGGATAGVTSLVLNNLGPDARQGGYDTVGLTLVDVGGGTSAPGHFVLASDTEGLDTDPMYGQVIVRPGLFLTVLTYDAANQRHVLASLPHSEVMEYAMLSGAAQSVWNMTTETVTDRGTDLRAGAEGGSLWMRVAGEYTKRDGAASIQGAGQVYTVDNAYKLYAGTAIGGMDLLSGDTGTFEYVVGAQLGYVSSSFDLTASPSSGRFTGATGGVYASLWNSRAFLDAALNLNGLTLDHDSPGLGSKTNTFLNSVGLRVDTGARWPLTDAIYVEPLASFAFARTGFEEISLPGGVVKPEDSKTARGALGLRVGGDYEGSAVNASYYLTGRAWNEFEGESAGSVLNPGAPLPFADDVSGAFREAEAGISLFNDANTLSGFLTTGVKWKEGYSAVDLSLGVRMAW